MGWQMTRARGRRKRQVELLVRRDSDVRAVVLGTDDSPEPIRQVMGWTMAEEEERAPPVATLPAGEITSTASPLSEEESLAQVRAWMAAQPDPVPRMPDERLQQRIRISERWVGKCPKAAGSHAAHNWGLYVDGMTVATYLAHPLVRGGRRRARRDLSWDLAHGFIWLQHPHEWALEQTSLQSSLEEES